MFGGRSHTPSAAQVECYSDPHAAPGAGHKVPWSWWVNRLEVRAQADSEKLSYAGMGSTVTQEPECKV